MYNHNLLGITIPIKSVKTENNFKAEISESKTQIYLLRYLLIYAFDMKYRIEGTVIGLKSKIFIQKWD